MDKIKFNIYAISLALVLLSAAVFGLGIYLGIQSGRGRSLSHEANFRPGPATPYAVGAAVRINGNVTTIQVEDGNYLPLQPLIDVLGGTTSWCDDTRQIVISHNNIRLRPNIRQATINGTATNLSHPLRISGDRSMVSLCFITRYMGLGVGYKNGTIIITSRAAQNIPVLMYHHILPREKNTYMPDNPWVISTENFTGQMRYLYENGFYPITIDDMEKFLFYGRNLPYPSVMIQFDDGYYSNFVYAAPIMRNYNMRGQIFLITSEIEKLGDTQPPLDYAALTFSAAHTIAAGRDVFESASHTHNLHDTVYGTTYTKLFHAMRDIIIEDTLRSFYFVENHRAFVFPQSQRSEYVENALQDAGIIMAFTGGNAPLTRNCNPLSLPRFSIYNETTLREFRNLMRRD